MSFYEAKVADILRCCQRDHQFVEELQSCLHPLLKLLGNKCLYRFYNVLNICVKSWYYCITSLLNLQTLGEEYTGTLRLHKNQKIPTQFVQVLWLVLYAGGEELFNKLLLRLQHEITASKSISEDIKPRLINLIQFIRQNKHVFMRIHQSIFYMKGAYYNVSNRITGIKYVLVRQWLQDDTSTQSFKFLGRISFLYLVYLLIQKFNASKREAFGSKEVVSSESTKGCVLCTENRKNTCATPCGHLFCWECIYESLKYQPNCPVCREVVNSSRIVYLQNYS